MYIRVGDNLITHLSGFPQMSERKHLWNNYEMFSIMGVLSKKEIADKISHWWNHFYGEMSNKSIGLDFCLDLVNH